MNIIKFKELEIDFRNVQTINELHILLKEVFGFPEFYRNNGHALFDCLSDIRFPENEMTKLTLEKDEILLIKTIGLSFKKEKISYHFFNAIEDVNKRYIEFEESPPFYLILT